MLNREFTISSKKYNKQITFFRSPGSGYIFVDINGKPGTTGVQICENGSTRGYTLTCYEDDQQEFQRICKKWWKSYLAAEREFGR